MFASACPHQMQVHPELLTKALLQHMQERGGSLQLAALTGVEAEGGRVKALHVRDSASGEEQTLAADAVVFAMGGWPAAQAEPGRELLCSMHWQMGRVLPVVVACRAHPLQVQTADCRLLCLLVLPFPHPTGAWSSQLASWLPASCPDVYSGLKVHSIVLADPQQRTTADALFLAYR